MIVFMVLMVAVALLVPSLLVVHGVSQARRAVEERRAGEERRQARMDREWWQKARRKTVMVHTIDDKTIRGLVLEVAPDGVLLGGAEYLDGAPVPLGGQLFIPKERVAMVQIPPRAAT